MTWTQLHKLFDAECRRTHARLKAEIVKGSKIPYLTEASKEKSGEVLRAADLACEFFAENQKWPIMEQAVVTECFIRLHAARDFSRFVASPDGQTAKYAESLAQKMHNRFSDSETIQWILVDYWWHAGIWADLYQNRID